MTDSLKEKACCMNTVPCCVSEAITAGVHPFHINEFSLCVSAALKTHRYREVNSMYRTDMKSIAVTQPHSRLMLTPNVYKLTIFSIKIDDANPLLNLLRTEGKIIDKCQKNKKHTNRHYQLFVPLW